MHLSPVGPLPASVYWLRRGALLLGLVALLFLLSRCAGGDDAPPAAESLAAASSPAPLPAASSSSASPSTSATPSPSASSVPTCADDDLAVTAGTDEALYDVGASPELTLHIENSSAAPCRRGIGSGSVELQVRSGRDRIWSSDDCGGEGRAGVTTLAPGDPKAATVSWNARRSRPGCTGDAERIEPGTYRLIGRIGELVVEGAVFTVVR